MAEQHAASQRPVGLPIFLVSLAIADDLLAVLVIAIFYSAQLSGAALAAIGAMSGVPLSAAVIGILGATVIAGLGRLVTLTIEAQAGRRDPS